ncbi:amino acid adenylation domain-containing protein [Photobacterium rosenbergii]|uniref:Amino acid adenylation domain-containing protein n=1 Tax=Photobacterium rosenbergii TaxID=294936 RepID=A0ABU3ZML1_9GAMM|nr:amino acid adenylation domain-containing protein [Photobacterium rosenbergii]MDV5171355.1 amino acid adenylation domain-containing protein [Photobacterium rosenbergii]
MIESQNVPCVDDETLAESLLSALNEAAQAQRIALDFQGRAYSYCEIQAQAAAIQQVLVDHGITQGDRVGLYLERSPAMVSAMLACLLSGVVFVPLDPLFPAARLVAIEQEAQLATVLGDSEVPAGPKFSCSLIQVLSGLPAEGMEPQGSDRSQIPWGVDLPPRAPAYMMFTSGSTGKPKGVVISYQALQTFLRASIDRLGLDKQCYWLLITTMAFDISMLEIFAPLLVGGRMVLTSSQEHKDPHAVAEYLDRFPQINVLQATPSFWRMLVNCGWQGKSDLMALSGGEALDGRLAQQLFGRCNELWNCYGPTEATVWSLMSRVMACDQNGPAIHIGSSLSGYAHWVLDGNGMEVAIGEEGELCILGAALSEGYWQRSDLTARQFVNHPESGVRYYRTGDRVRKLGEDSFHYLGRFDDQVKLRGYRIELGEIESQLRNIPQVGDAAVRLEGEGGVAMLVAYLEVESLPSRLQLRKLLSNSLPAYMIPSRFNRLDCLPKTASGKVDRKRLEEATGVT